MADKPDVSDNNQQRNWLQRILDRWHVYARGDVIAGQVGEKASNVLIGKNLIQIGSIKMPIWLAVLAATGVIIGVISIILITRNVAAVTSFVMAPTLTPTITPIPTATPTPTITPTPTPAPMTGDFNVAIAAFEVTGAGDGLLWANELVQGFANSVEQIVHELSNELGDEIEIRFPDQVAAVTGQTDSERVSNARRVAQEIKADVVIYGVVEVNELQATIKPEFYVNELRNRELTTLDTGAAELVGPYRMGLPIDVEKIDNRSSRNQAEAALRKRLDALIYIVIGLSDFAIGAYAEAETRFLQASELQAWNNPDVIYVMLGNAALQQEKLTQADEYYQQAIAANEFYTRAYIGRGSVLYGIVRRDAALQNDFAQVDRDQLAQAIALYQRALDPTLEQPPFADVSTKANFGLGQTYFLLG
ncbi:MAG: hypothetical protein R3E79_50220 [Caldilineaceae bacterium]